MAEPGNTAIHARWWQQSGDTLASTVCDIVDGLEKDDEARRTRYLENHSLYELRALTGLNASGYYTVEAYDGVTLPVLRSICDTVQADIAGRQRPLPMFQTKDADWATRRRAKKLGKFVEAVLHQPQGTYVNGWELSVDAFLDSCIDGIGCINVYVDELTEKVVLEKVKPEELHLDPREADEGEPLNWFRTYLMDEDKALAEFLPPMENESEEESSDETGDGDEAKGDGEDPAESGDKYARPNAGPDATERKMEQFERELKRAEIRSAIERAATQDDGINIRFYGRTRVARSVKVREAIRIPIKKDDPGKRVFAVPGKVLHQEEWHRDHPYVFFIWSRPRRGFWPVSLIDEAKALAEELNEWFESCQERVKLCANRRTFVPRGAGIDDSDMEANESENIIYFDGPIAPVVQDVPALQPADFQYGQMVKGLCYEMPGVSQMSAQGRKEPGVTSGIAIRTMQDLATKRFAVKARYAYEYPFVALARKIVAAIAEYVEATGNDITVRLPQKRGMREFKWSAVALEAEYDIQVTPASSLPSDPAGRLATIQDLFAAQVISGDTFKRLLDWPDLDQELARERAEWEYVENLIEGMLDAKPDDEDYRYEGPDDYLLHPEDALFQVSGSYFEAKTARAPEFNLGLLRNYMLELGKLIEKRNAPQEAPAQAIQPSAPEAMMAGLPPTPMPPGLAGALPLPPGAPPGALAA